jgi:hypothetical protein
MQLLTSVDYKQHSIALDRHARHAWVLNLVAEVGGYSVHII